MKTRLMGLAALAGVGVLMAGCGVGNDKSREDAEDVSTQCTQGQTEHCIDKSAPQVLGFNNHYPDVEIKCDGHGHRVYLITHDSGTGRDPVVIPDPTCPGYVKGAEPIVVTP